MHPAQASASEPTVAHAKGKTEVLVGVCSFAVALTMVDRGLVQVPLSFLLKDKLNVSPLAMSVFMMVGGSPFWLKPITGLISDSFPILGSRRRSYLLLGAILAAIGWMALSLLPLRYGVLLTSVFIVSLATTIISSTSGAVQVEEGQALGTSGKLSSIRSLSSNLANLAGAGLGGYLTGRSFGWVCGIAASVMLAMIPLLAALTVETDKGHRGTAGAKIGLMEHWRTIRSARSMWITILVLICIDLAPGLETTLFYIQTDVNHFSAPFISTLKVARYVAMFSAGVIYFRFSGRLTMRSLLLGIILLGGLTPFGYLNYRTHGQALLVDSIYFLVYELGTIVLVDLAVLTNPKGSEVLAFGILFSGMMIASTGSDVVGEFLYGTLHVPFSTLVCINAGITLLALFLVPLLPSELLNRREEVS